MNFKMDNELVFNWSIQYKCNYNCPYCFYYDAQGIFKDHNEELDIEKWLKVWDKIHELYGAVRIELDGGDPILYNSFERLVSELSKEHRCRVLTNLSCDMHSLVNNMNKIGDISDKLEMEISYHPLFSRFDQFLEKVLFLKDKGIDIRILYVAYPPQLKQMRRVKEKFENRGLGFKAIPFWGRYRTVNYPDGYSKEERDFLQTILGKPIEDSIIVKEKLCGAGYRYVHVEPDGNVYRCWRYVGSGEPMGNLFNDFQLLSEPCACDKDICSHEFKWLINNGEKVYKILKKRKGVAFKFEKVKYRKLGNTGIVVSEVGIGGHPYDAQGHNKHHTFEQRLEIIGKAIELGINYFDNCDGSEAASLGKVLKALNSRKKCYIAYGENVEGFRVYNANEKIIREGIEHVLKLLCSDYIDVFRIIDNSIRDFAEKMKIDKGEEIARIAHIFSKLKKEGKIRFTCYSTHLYNNLMPNAGEADIGNLFDVIQLRYNFLENGAANKIIPYAKEHNMGVVVMKPFRKGTLLNKTSGDFSDPTYKDMKSPDNPMFVNLKYKEKGLAYALLKYILSNPDISVVIPGVASVEQVIENARVSIES